MDSVFCTNCGKYSVPGSQFCMSCGAALGATNAGASRERKRSGGILLAIVLCVSAALVLIAWLSWRVAPGADGNVEAVLPEASVSPCKLSDITIDKLRGVAEDGGFARITGRVVNHCASAVGVELKITFYGKDGDILKVDDGFWPASVHNIAAGQEYTFEAVEDRADGFRRFEVEVVGLNVW